jgi:hypothetical protein
MKLTQTQKQYLKQLKKKKNRRKLKTIHKTNKENQ